MSEEKREIYLDYHATTPVLPQVLEAMSPYFCQNFGNANSSHQWGWKAEMALAKASKQVADLVKCKASQVYFTSGATESIHWAIVGWIRKNKNGKILTTATEHKATFGACDFAQELGAEVEIIPVDSYGKVQMQVVQAAIPRDRPCLLSFIYGNNEIGTVNSIEEICKLKNQFSNLTIHADAAQCVGKIPINFAASNLDLLSFSGHKLYAPKGVGALIVKDPDALAPLFSGGGQQRGMRAGTTDVPSIVGLGVACEWAGANLESEKTRYLQMAQLIIKNLLATGKVQLNGHPTDRLPNNLNFTFRDISLDRLLLKLPKVGFSTSSACTTGTASTSHVLKAIGLSDQEARRTIRFGMGQGTTMADMEYVLEKIMEILEEA